MSRSHKWNKYHQLIYDEIIKGGYYIPGLSYTESQELRRLKDTNEQKQYFLKNEEKKIIIEEEKIRDIIQNKKNISSDEKLLSREKLNLEKRRFEIIGDKNINDDNFDNNTILYTLYQDLSKKYLELIEAFKYKAYVTKHSVPDISSFTPSYEATLTKKEKDDLALIDERIELEKNTPYELLPFSIKYDDVINLLSIREKKNKKYQKELKEFLTRDESVNAAIIELTEQYKIILDQIGKYKDEVINIDKRLNNIDFDIDEARIKREESDKDLLIKLKQIEKHKEIVESEKEKLKLKEEKAERLRKTKQEIKQIDKLHNIQKNLIKHLV
jgi:hypothetical protein